MVEVGRRCRCWWCRLWQYRIYWQKLSHDINKCYLCILCINIEGDNHEACLLFITQFWFLGLGSSRSTTTELWLTLMLGFMSTLTELTLTLGGGAFMLTFTELVLTFVGGFTLTFTELWSTYLGGGGLRFTFTELVLTLGLWPWFMLIEMRDWLRYLFYSRFIPSLKCWTF